MASSATHQDEEISVADSLLNGTPAEPDTITTATGVATARSGVRTQSERRAETERRVLDAALRLIADHGTRGISLAQVGVEAGYSRGIVTHQFGSKDELLRRVAVYAQEVLMPPPDTGVRGLERLVHTIDNYVQYMVHHKPAIGAFLLMWVEGVAAEPALRQIFTERDAWFRDLVAQQIADGIDEGSIRSDLDPAAAALVLVGQLRGIGLQLMLSPDSAVFEAIRHAALEIVRSGLAAQPSVDGEG